MFTQNLIEISAKIVDVATKLDTNAEKNENSMKRINDLKSNIKDNANKITTWTAEYNATQNNIHIFYSNLYATKSSPSTVDPHPTRGLPEESVRQRQYTAGRAKCGRRNDQ